MTTVHCTRLIDAPVDRVWSVVREFGGLDRWVPSVPGPAEVVGDPTGPGAERIFRKDGETLAVERLVALDDERRTTSYTIVSAPMALDEHLATLTVTEEAGGSRVTWEASFTADPAAADLIAKAMADGTFEPGLERLAALCARLD